LSDISISKEDADPLKSTSAQVGFPHPTPMRRWHVCEKSFVLTDGRLSERMQKKLE
jgi:hypothetical protein